MNPSDKPLTIVHTEASCGWGGQEIRILSEASGMIARGHRVTLLCPPEARIFSEAPKRGVPVLALPIGRKKIGGVLAMRRWLKANPVDVVNTHSSTDAWLVAVACASLPDPPAIVRTRHISAPIPNNRATRWLYLKATQHVATTGEKLKQRLMVENRYPEAHLTSVPTGIDTDWFVPADTDAKSAARAAVGLPVNAPIVGILATLRSWKGHRYLIDAFARLRNTATRLVIVGDGPQFEALQQQVAALGLGERVTMPGNQNDVRPWLQSFDVFALPSYANEGVPQALMQAMACGLPCISTDVGSIGELIVDGRTGLMVEPQAVEPLQAALERLLADPAERARLGAAARAHCAAGFGREAMLDRMETIFRKALR